MNKRFLWIGILILIILVVGVYYFEKDFNTSAQSISISTANWLTYDGGTWTIKYPSTYQPKTRRVLTDTTDVQFNFNDTSDYLISAHQSNLSTDTVIGPIVSQQDPNHTNVLSDILQIQKEGGGGIQIISAQKTMIDTNPAIQYVTLDSSDLSHPSYDTRTTFNKNDKLVLLTFSTASTQPDPNGQQIYNAMLQSFSFK